MKRNVLIVAGLLTAVVAIFLVVRTLGEVSPVSGSPLDAKGAVSKPTNAQPLDNEGLPQWQSFFRPQGKDEVPQRPVRRLEPSFSNPFGRVPTEMNPQGLPFRLEGVAPSSAVALVSGRVLRLGETIEGFRLHRIDSAGIELHGRGGDSHYLTFGGSPTLDPVLP